MAEPSAIDLDAIRARYARIGTPKLLWQEVCIDIAAMADEIARLREEIAAWANLSGRAVPE